jgi:hypothetical protein
MALLELKLVDGAAKMPDEIRFSLGPSMHFIGSAGRRFGGRMRECSYCVFFSGSRDASELFVSLARRAGSGLPASVLRARKVGLRGGPAAIWCAFVFSIIRGVDKSFLGAVEGLPETAEIMRQPLLASVRAIEMLEEATPVPELPGHELTGKKRNGNKRSAGRCGRSRLEDDKAKLNRYRAYVREWRTGKHKTYAECAAAFGPEVEATDIRRALDCARHKAHLFKKGKAR